MSDVVVCPVCTGTVSTTSSMCFGCHLPMKDVLAAQSLRRRTNRSRTTRRLTRRVVAGFAYVGIAAWFAYRMPSTVTFVVPAAVAAVWLHVVRGHAILGALAFLAWMVVVPAVFWPSMLTDLGNDLSGLLP
ncbi:MAG TPA: hypothetical protein VFY86_15380 [Nocardioides sp.]|nr:hypothetical protein [uncultured Nocardioides sp.]HEX5987906.1 hypothetical protein [Nocardioides sp.]